MTRIILLMMTMGAMLGARRIGSADQMITYQFQLLTVLVQGPNWCPRHLLSLGGGDSQPNCVAGGLYLFSSHHVHGASRGRAGIEFRLMLLGMLHAFGVSVALKHQRLIGRCLDG